ncbi:ATP-dependent Clp protease ATP-binding subunit [Ideonella sp. 4Y16]|uniref:AAA family ATPase n=1 Tax=Ideonella alba TaxID=2824118 RepID=UPI001B36C08F|nr:AAA family ATPase [Ideonella alba]MBQ0942243.1 ATP-dependent Clp protease ATP-binding subunit [Ideonella alba]
MSNAARSLAAALAAGREEEQAELGAYLHDLTAQAQSGRLSPVVGRESEILQVLEVASQRRKANAVLIGPAGAGKTAVAEGLAQLCALHGERLPGHLRGLRILQLDVGAIMAGAGVYGTVEQRMGMVLRAAEAPGTLLFIDELHTLVGAGGRAGQNDLAQWLKPHLARGDLRVLAATTAEEYHQIIARDAAMERRFSPIYIRPMSDAAALRACESHARWLKLNTPPPQLRPVLRHVVALARRLLRHRSMPDAAIDLLERSVAIAQLADKPLARAHVAQAAARLSHLPEDLLRRLRVSQRTPGARGPVAEGDDAVVRRGVAQACAHLLALFSAAAPPSPDHAACMVEVPGSDSVGRRVADRLAMLLETQVVELDAELSEREVYGAEPGYIGHGQRRPIHRLQDQPFAAVHLRGAAQGASGRRLLSDLRGGAFTDTEGRQIPVHLAVISTEGGARAPMGFTAR